METYSRILPWRISETEEQATVHIVSKSQTLNQLSMYTGFLNTHTHTHKRSPLRRYSSRFSLATYLWIGHLYSMS